jgi:aromatic-L-amino-acid/L-tryptophan decarboxylase
VCFRYNPKGQTLDDTRLDGLNEALLAHVNATRRVHLTHTRLGGRFVIRVAVGQRQTGREHIAELWRLLNDGVAALQRA